MYYKYVEILVKVFAARAESIINIGSASAPMVEDFHWIPKKYILDPIHPYYSSRMASIKKDLMEFSAKQTFDFALCLQVLEYIADPKSFAHTLFSITDRVLISVPYKWPPGNDANHLHDSITKERLYEWTGREPNYSLIVEEPLQCLSEQMNRSLLCYYDATGEEIDYEQTNLHIEKLSESNHGPIYGKDSSEALIYSPKDTSDYGYGAGVQLILEAQDLIYTLMDTRLEMFTIQKELHTKKTINEKINQQIQRIEQEISKHRRGITQEKELKQKHLKEYNKIIASNSWKFMRPLRAVGSLLRKGSLKG